MKKLAVLDVGGSAIKYCTMCGPGLEGKGKVPTPTGRVTTPSRSVEAIEGIRRPHWATVEGRGPLHARRDRRAPEVHPDGRRAALQLRRRRDGVGAAPRSHDRGRERRALLRDR